MNEHQLKSDAYSLVLHRLKAKRDADYIRDAVVRMAKAYADARVAETIEGWKITREHLQNQVSAKDTEIAELKASLSQAQQMYTDLLVGTTDAINAKDAEIKRLRDGIKKGFEKLAEIPYCSVLRTIFDNAKGVQDDLESLLSPAPVTETQNEDQYE